MCLPHSAIMPDGMSAVNPMISLHRWDLSPKEAIALQERYRGLVLRAGAPTPIRMLAGLDAAYGKDGDVVCAAAALFSFPELQLLEQAAAELPCRFPYLPGLLAFREAPALLAALQRLHTTPDLLLLDGHGMAHPRRFGIARHVGLLLNMPAVGVAKHRLVGTHQPPGMSRGRWQPLWDGDEMIGAVLRTQSGVRPIFVSVGHRISLEHAVEVVLGCSPRYRLPEPIRAAHRWANRSLRSTAQ